VYQLISQPFLIAVRKTVNVISSTGINLFTVTVIAVYKEDLAADLELVLLTEAADYLELENAQILTNPTTYTLTFGNGGSDISGGCMSAGLLCLQLFTIESSDIPCPTILTGGYTFQFDLGCNPAILGYADAATTCANYVNEYGGSVTLSTDFEWSDFVCDPLVFLIDFDANLTFWTNESFVDQLGSSEQYSLGQQAYVQVFYCFFISTLPLLCDVVKVSTLSPSWCLLLTGWLGGSGRPCRLRADGSVIGQRMDLHDSSEQ